MEASYQLMNDVDPEETPQDSGVMIHIVPEKAVRWNHIEDLDAFFTQIYTYHQSHGFACMMVKGVLELLQFIFIVFFCVFLFNCVNYPVLFRDEITNKTVNQKVTLSDAVLSCDQCLSNMGFWTWIIIIFSILVWLYHAVQFLSHAFRYWDLKGFFNVALKISDSELDNVTWHEVQSRIREAQQEQQMCIHTTEISQLDIYHRILRFKNYLVAMVNKSLLPVRLNIPLLGEKLYMSHGLKYNYELLLFRGPWSPFDKCFKLKESYRKLSHRQQIAQQLQTLILCVGIINLVFSPLIFLWQIAFAFFNYAELLKREPGALGVRCWSVYARLYLRHFNEMEHELCARLNRAYEPAAKYVSGFASPLMIIIAKNIQFVAGAISSVLIALSIYDEDVLAAEHVLTVITVSGAIFAAFRSFIPDENMVWRPESLMTQILAHVHYLPYSWRGLAHTTKVHQDFSQLFQYKATFLLEELISPVITPVILLFHLKPKALDIIDFFRNFTVEVTGLGDVCSFAEMDVGGRHGNPCWQSPTNATACGGDQYDQAEEGKTELSLIHFTYTNPDWKPPKDAQKRFVPGLITHALQDPSHYLQINADFVPQNYFGSYGFGLSSMIPRISAGMPGPSHAESPSIAVSPPGNINTFSNKASRAEGPLSMERWNRYMLPHQTALLHPSLGASVFGPGMDNNLDRFENVVSEMSNSALFLHEVHHRQVRRRGFHESSEPVPIWQRAGIVSSERTPLLPTPSHPS
ncbi:autophagy-related protein 9 isoform X2 [Lycorma delicatula]